MAIKFFADEGVSNLADRPYNTPRPIVASTERLNVGKGAQRVDKRQTSAWQTTAWQCFDAIGEVHFAFSLLGQIASRVTLYPAVIEQQDQAPIEVADYVKRITEKTGSPPEHTLKTLDYAVQVVNDLALHASGGIANLLRLMTLNFCVPGEMYLCYVNDEWCVASTDELTQNGDTLTYRTSKTARISKNDRPATGITLPKDAFVARIWRPHPRWTGEPDSSMLGTLDDCDLLVLLQQAMRSITRSRMNAGIMFIPEGITSFVTGAEGVNVEDAISASSVESVENETAQSTVVPLILKGPAELGEKIRWIPYGRQIDQQFIDLLDKTLQRVLQGLDIPKEIVAGLSDAKFANAIVITDELFKAHIEPLILLAVDSLTTVYFRPMLRKYLGIPDGSPEANDSANIVNRLVIWADTSKIATRPDKSQAANDGFDRSVLSARAWRETRGFTEVDAPSRQELLLRLVMTKGVIPPDVAELVIQSIDPDFFAQARADNTDVPEEIEKLLSPLTGEQPAEEGEVPTDVAPIATPSGASTPLDQQLSGADVNPNGTLPPRQVPVPTG